MLVHDLLRSPVTESRMETSSIIAKLDPPRNIFASLLPGRVNGPVHQLNLQRTVDRFGQGIVIAYSGPPYRLPYPELFQRPGEPGRRVVTSPVGIKPNTA